MSRNNRTPAGSEENLSGVRLGKNYDGGTGVRVE